MQIARKAKSNRKCWHMVHFVVPGPPKHTTYYFDLQDIVAPKVWIWEYIEMQLERKSFKLCKINPSAKNNFL